MAFLGQRAMLKASLGRAAVQQRRLVVRQPRRGGRAAHREAAGARRSRSSRSPMRERLARVTRLAASGVAGGERGSRAGRIPQCSRQKRVRATETRRARPFRVLERRHGLAEIVGVALSSL